MRSGHGFEMRKKKIKTNINYKENQMTTVLDNIFIPKYTVVVNVKDGVVVRDRPAPESRGAARIRTEPVGKVLFGWKILNVEGVDYVGLVPQNPLKTEWVRRAERDNSIVYVDVQPLDEASAGDGQSAIADALNRIAFAIDKLAQK